MAHVRKERINVTLDPACKKWVDEEVKRRERQGRQSNRSQVVNEAVLKMAERGK